MQYMGGKERIATPLAAALLRSARGRELLVEPFVGGGSTAARLAPSFRAAMLTDAHEDLVLCWQAALCGWEPPAEVPEDLYRELKEAPPSPLRGFAGFGCSFGGKWLGTYARGADYAGAARRSLLRKVAALRRCPTMDLFRADYRSLAPGLGAVVYCDPPYRGTEGYSTGVFDSDEFWGIAAAWARAGAEVFVSEYEAPPGWTSIWQRSVGLQMAGGTIGARGDEQGLLFGGGGEVATQPRLENLFRYEPTLRRR
jgi:DNA adenine methylase